MMEVLFSGESSNWLGDRHTHVVLQAGPKSALSIHGGVHQVDKPWGFGNYDRGAEGLLEAIQKADRSFEIMSVKPLRLLAPDEMPDIAPHPSTGLRTITCDLPGFPGDNVRKPASAIAGLVRRIADNEDQLEPDYHTRRALSEAKMRADMRQWKTRVVLDKGSAGRCHANPHPSTGEGTTFTICSFAALDGDRIKWPWAGKWSLILVLCGCFTGSSAMWTKGVLENKKGVRRVVNERGQELGGVEMAEEVLAAGRTTEVKV
jgi:hypothetical protein